MNALIIFCHPERNSFNGSMAAMATKALEEQSYNVETIDLYGEDFDPREGPVQYGSRVDDTKFSALNEQRHAYKSGTLPAEVSRHINMLERADFVLLQFPIWWHSAPAMLKGWIDRVFVSGGLYTSTKRYDQGHFRGKLAMCSATIGAPEEAIGSECRAGSIDQLFWSTQYSLHYMGFKVLPPFLATSVQGHGYSTDDATTNRRRLQQHKEDLVRRLQTLDTTPPLSYPSWQDWDALGAKR